MEIAISPPPQHLFSPPVDPWLGKKKNTTKLFQVENAPNKCHQALKFAFHPDQKGQMTNLCEYPSTKKGDFFFCERGISNKQLTAALCLS